MGLRIAVLGSGLIGLASAYFLKRDGHDVVVIDRQKGPGLEASFANGALLTPSMSDPWNAPGCWRVLLGSLWRADAPLQLRFNALPSLAGWGISFLKNSSPGAYERNTSRNLKLALYSLGLMESLRQETGVDYGRGVAGALRIFGSLEALDRAEAQAARLARQGLNYRRLSRAETVTLEPALAAIAGELSGGIHYEMDETGDAHRFCESLRRSLERAGVEFRFGTAVSGLEVRAAAVTALCSGSQRIEAEAFVLAAGSYTTPLLSDVGIKLPVRPAKGYSVTFPCASVPLRVPVVDDRLHAVVVPLAGAVRVAGTAEFAGYDLTLRPERIQNLLELVRRVLPNHRFDAASARPWCGLRPMSADGVPIIGRMPLKNLWVNTGHGHLGWTMAAGSGRLLADLVARNQPGVDPSGYAFERFGGGRG